MGVIWEKSSVERDVINEVGGVVGGGGWREVYMSIWYSNTDG